MGTQDMPHGIVGFKFAQCLANGDFEKAYTLLSPDLKTQYSPPALKREFDSMSELFQLTPEVYKQQNWPWIQVMDNHPHEEMDLNGWAYVAIGTEAVTVTVKRFGTGYLITDLEWGRP